FACSESESKRLSHGSESDSHRQGEWFFMMGSPWLNRILAGGLSQVTEWLYRIMNIDSRDFAKESFGSGTSSPAMYCLQASMSPP
ncbi:MAG: hypothetical protein ACKOAH_09705, partial [Pirellula sp.]